MRALGTKFEVCLELLCSDDVIEFNYLPITRKNGTALDVQCNDGHCSEGLLYFHKAPIPPHFKGRNMVHVIAT